MVRVPTSSHLDLQQPWQEHLFATMVGGGEPTSHVRRALDSRADRVDEVASGPHAAAPARWRLVRGEKASGRRRRGEWTTAKTRFAASCTPLCQPVELVLLFLLFISRDHALRRQQDNC